MTDLLSFAGANFQDPAPNWRWLAHLPELPAARAPNSKALITLRPLYSLPKNQLYVEAFEEPAFTIDANNRHQGGRTIHYPRFLVPQTYTMSLIEDHESSVYRYFMTWKSFIFNPTGMYYYEPYRENGATGGEGKPGTAPFGWHWVKFQQFGILSNTTPLRDVDFLSWPSAVNSQNWSYQGSSHTVVTVTMACNGLRLATRSVGGASSFTALQAI